MLEEKIEKLQSSIEELTAAIKALTVSAQEPIKMVVADQPPATNCCQTSSEAQGDAIEPESILEQGPNPVSLEDLHKICMEIVRKNKSDKTKIKTVLARFNADLLKDLDPVDYEKVKAELEII